MQTASGVIYALAIGVFVVLTVGFGSVTFYPAPSFDTGPRPVSTIDE